MSAGEQMDWWIASAIKRLLNRVEALREQMVAAEDPMLAYLRGIGHFLLRKILDEGEERSNCGRVARDALREVVKREALPVELRAAACDGLADLLLADTGELAKSMKMRAEAVRLAPTSDRHYLLGQATVAMAFAINDEPELIIRGPEAEYKVVYRVVIVRTVPSTEGPKNGLCYRNEALQGMPIEVGGEMWLKTHRGWLLMDGKSLNLGRLVQRADEPEAVEEDVPLGAATAGADAGLPAAAATAAAVAAQGDSAKQIGSRRYKLLMEARNCFRRTIDRDASFTAAYSELNIVLEELGCLEEARTFARRCIHRAKHWERNLQRPFNYHRGLPSQPWHDGDAFELCTALDSASAQLREELGALLAAVPNEPADVWRPCMPRSAGYWGVTLVDQRRPPVVDSYLDGQISVWMGITHRGHVLEEREGGIRVESVVPGGPADEAGILAGDMLVSWGHAVITDTPSWLAVLAGHQPGDEVDVGVERGDGNLVKVPLRLRAREASPAAPEEPPSPSAPLQARCPTTLALLEAQPAVVTATLVRLAPRARTVTKCGPTNLRLACVLGIGRRSVGDAGADAGAGAAGSAGEPAESEASCPASEACEGEEDANLESPATAKEAAMPAADLCCAVHVGAEALRIAEFDGGSMVFDSSYEHSFENLCRDAECAFLLIHFWHPELSRTEWGELSRMLDE